MARVAAAISLPAVLASLLTLPEARAASSRDGLTLEEIDPLATTPEMRAFIDRRISGGQPRMVRLEGLRDALFDPDDGLGVTYGSSATQTAAGTFETRTGNCLSFTLLFVSLARHLDLEAYFVEVDEVTGWSQRGEVGLNHWHMYAEGDLFGDVARVDFLPWTETRYRSSRRISERRARAHFHNNVGADALTRGENELALAHFDHALELDPTFAPARINRSVALRRSGQSAAAEAGLLEVLDVEPGNAVAAANLASLYLLTDREREAKKWLARRETFLNRNPFHHFRLGLRALQDDELDEARTHFKRAIQRQSDEPVFYEKLAVAQARLGHPRKARSSLKRALQVTQDPERRALIERRLDQNEDSPS